MPWQRHQPSRPPPAYALSLAPDPEPTLNEVAEVWPWEGGLQLTVIEIPTRDTVLSNQLHLYF